MYYIELFRRSINNFDVIADYTYDWTYPAIAYNPSNYNIPLMLDKIDKGEVEYFNFRLRVLKDNVCCASGTIEHCVEKRVENMLIRDANEIDEFIETLILEAQDNIKVAKTEVKKKK